MELNYVNIMWVMVAAILVFFMQAGFAMVEAGFSRAKNTGNILMKNLVDFAVATPIYFMFGFALMFGESLGGLVGITGFFNPEAMGLEVFEELTPGVFIFFQTVFAATAATIVSGAMAERTKFIAYVIYSAVISLFIYPVVGHWIWGGGWLSQLGFVDFAGSTVVHSVGGWAALMGAAIIGPRLGKYNADGSVNAIPGHSLALGALGVFILWFGWFGFNPGSTLGVTAEVGHIAMTTNMSAAVGAVVAVFLTWIRYGKPDVGMSLNGALAGLVAITAGCQVITVWGALCVGIIAGFVIVYGVEFLDKVVKIDDPVGAVGVHCMCGVTGTLAVGLFANYAPGTENAVAGLFYGGGAELLLTQAIGVLATAVWTLGTTFILFTVIKKTIGLRASKTEEIQGLDRSEHATESYADFVLRA